MKQVGGKQLNAVSIQKWGAADTPSPPCDYKAQQLSSFCRMYEYIPFIPAKFPRYKSEKDL